MLQSNLIPVDLDVTVFGRRGIGPAAAFVHRLIEKHNLSETVFPVNDYGYLTALNRFGWSDKLNYIHRNRTGNWFHTPKWAMTAAIIDGSAVDQVSERLLSILYITAA